MQTLGEFAAQRRSIMLHAVHVRGQTHHQMLGFPLFNQGFDSGKFFGVFGFVDGGNRVRHAHFGIALGHAYARHAKIETQCGAAWCFKHGLLLAPSGPRLCPII